MIVKHHRNCDHGNPEKKTTFDREPSELINRGEKLLNKMGKGYHGQLINNSLKALKYHFFFSFYKIVILYFFGLSLILDLYLSINNHVKGKQLTFYYAFKN